MIHNLDTLFARGLWLRALLWLVMIGGVPLGRAQSPFTSADLPVIPGAWYRAYVNTSGVDVASWVAAKGGPQRWDFSAGRAASDRIDRTDVVGVGDGEDGSRFVGAVYAEQVTRENSAVQAWSYYSVAPGQGRFYYGFHDAVSNASNPAKVFHEPTLELPELAYGQTWERAVTFEDAIDVGLGIGLVPILVSFRCQASVDAWGTVVLPGLGEQPALRVHELHRYISTEASLGLPLGTHYVRSYYWLVKGIGKAVQVTSKGTQTPPPEAIGRSAYVHRVFASSAYPSGSRLVPVSSLQVSRKGDEVFLSWSAVPESSAYVVFEASSVDPAASWSAMATNRDAFLFTPLPRDAGQRFFKAYGVTGSGSAR